MPWKLSDPDLHRVFTALSIPLAISGEGMVFFGVRGAVPTGEHGELDGSKPVNYETMRCTIGQWSPKSGKLDMFLASTVPTLRYVEGAADRGGRGCNQVFPGIYRFTKGQHRAGTPTGHWAFREAGEKLICRTDDDGLYEPETDDVSLDSPADNLHAAWGTQSYSSAGCQVVSGKPGEGQWESFKSRAYEVQQEVYRYLLLPSGVWAALAKSGEPAIAIGSVGERAKAVQEALVNKGLLAVGDEDGIFGPRSGLALLRFQRQRSELAADGICSADDARLLGVVGW